MEGVKSLLKCSFLRNKLEIFRYIINVCKQLCTYFFSLFIKKITIFKKNFIILSFIVDFIFFKNLFKQESLYGI